MENENEADIKNRIIICGNTSVGKSNLILRYMKDDFDYEYRTTIGVDYFTKEFKKNEEKISIQFFDTAGQEKYQALSCNYYRLSDGVVIVYDVTNRESFNKCEFWLNEVFKSQTKNNIILLIGNKIDLDQDRKVSKEEGKKFAQDHKLFFMEASAKSNQDNCVNKAFEIIVNEIIEKAILEKEQNLIKELGILDKKSIMEFEETKKNKSCC